MSLHLFKQGILVQGQVVSKLKSYCQNNIVQADHCVHPEPRESYGAATWRKVVHSQETACFNFPEQIFSVLLNPVALT